MKKIRIMLMAAFLLIGLAACNTNDNNNSEDNQKNQSEDQATENTNNETTEDNAADDNNNDTAGTKENNDNKTDQTNGDDMAAKMQDLDFAEIELSVEYDQDKEYEAEIDKNASGNYEAEVDDEINNNHLKGQEAFDHLYPIVQKINVNPDSSKDEVINSVLDAFELDKNYQEFDVEFKFHDGKKLEYEDDKK